MSSFKERLQNELIKAEENELKLNTVERVFGANLDTYELYKSIGRLEDENIIQVIDRDNQKIIQLVKGK